MTPDTGIHFTSTKFDFEQPPSPWVKISDIAKRVGVAPSAGGPATVLIEGADGNMYDMFDVVAAVLDVGGNLAPFRERVEAVIAAARAEAFEEAARIAEQPIKIPYEYTSVNKALAAAIREKAKQP